MGLQLNYIQEAAEAIQQVIRAFKIFRINNSPLNEFLTEIESIVEKKAECKETEPSTVETLVELPNLGCDNESINVQSDFIDSTSADAAVTYSIPTHIENLNGRESIQKYCIASNATDSLEQNLVESKGGTGTATEDETEVENEKSVEEQVFGIDLVLEAILQNLSASTLKTCRCVNFSWNSVATKVLLKREALFAEFKYYKRSNTFSTNLQVVHNNSNNTKKHNLNQNNDLASLTELIANRKTCKFKFPCNHFIFTDGNLTATSLQNFLLHNGHIISHLLIELTDEDQVNESKFLHDFKKMLTVYAPNLETLEIGKFPEIWDDEDYLTELFPEPQAKLMAKKNNVLPKLKSLHFLTPAPVKIFSDLISAANNLTSISLTEDCDNCDAMVDALLKSNKLSSKVGALSSLEITLHNGNFKLYENLASRSNLALKKLTIYYEHKMYLDADAVNSRLVAQVIEKLLRACSGSLVELHTRPLGHCFPIEIPVMPKLLHIVITKYGDAHEKMFPSGTVLSQVFPSLNSIKSERLYTQPEYIGLNWEPVFGAGSQDRLWTVKTTIFDHGPPLPWLSNFSHMFSNLTEIKIGIVYDFVSASGALWKLSHLETLELIVWVDTHKKWNDYPALEQGFTGFSKETCLQLYKTSRDVDLLDLASLEDLRESGSILDAKCLKKLHLIVRDLRSSKRYLSHVTGLFAFGMCPELEVTLSFEANTTDSRTNLQNGLSPIYPFVHAVTKSSRDVSMLTLP